VVDALEAFLQLAARNVAGVGAGEEVFLDRQVAEAVAAFHHLHHALLHQFVRRQLVDALAAEGDRALGHLAALALEQGGDRLQRGALAGAVGAEQGDDPALPAPRAKRP
jgi:predicted dinucleotide-binding enzyme